MSEHIEICKENSACKIEVPKPGETITFQIYKKSMRVPFVIYADFEAVTEKIDSATPNPEKSYTEKYQKHTPSKPSKIMLNLLYTEVKIVCRNFVK